MPSGVSDAYHAQLGATLTLHTERPIKDHQRELDEAFQRDTARLQTPFSSELLATIRAARRERVANKTRELARERKGEVIARTLQRRRGGPPAPVLSTMTPEQIRLDKAARSVSEVGFAGLAKKKLGFRLKNKDGWRAEDGKEKNREWLDRMARSIEKENVRRRERAERS